MKVILFGATGMVGQGVLRECLQASDVDEILTIGRTPLDTSHRKLRNIVLPDLFDYRDIQAHLTGYDACFFCLGVSAAGLDEMAYTHLTYDLTLAAAQTLAARNPGMTFIYVSGAGTDSTERGRSMWARVKGRTENALQRLPFKAVYLFRPGIIQPMHGARSKTGMYQAFYTVMRPFFPLMRAIAPRMLTTERVGRAMLAAARGGAPQAVLEANDIYLLAESGAGNGK
ncbi:NAD(P)H-binding protein [Dyella sp. GSA-30]|uniref:NAD(P)H-binding protein n=1 Tax=Dyella sp. GSA-30 TaxID=2994496 RepID=UPI002490D379|nr:NAD(P)H-binding protein [Dyella sp. GSA-30]BDU20025.1 epimerase [Dyella sp. GSA-30]